MEFPPISWRSTTTWGWKSRSAIGTQDPELQVRIRLDRLAPLGLSPVAVADAVQRLFVDVAAGSVRVGEQSWLVRVVGKQADPEYLAQLPLLTAAGEVRLDQVAEVVRARERADRLVAHGGEPAVMLWVFKRPETNIIDLVERLRGYIDGQRAVLAGAGLELRLVDDQTTITRSALRVMQTNALLGLTLVLFVTWLFLGSRIALLTSIGIPFTLAGTFWLLGALGQTLNVTVLLGVVIGLGMLVDDAVVVVEAIYYRMVRGAQVMEASLGALREVFAPVTTSVLTTIAAFMPLMLMPGIVGEFMLVVPLVVTTALAISLLEAYWMLPAHMHAFHVGFARPGRVQRRRTRALRWIRTGYTRLLIKVLRRPLLSLLLVGLLVLGALGSFLSGMVRTEFFAFDPVRLFYVNVEMPPGTSLEKTLERTVALERELAGGFLPGEVRGSVSFAGLALTETEPLFGDHLGQVFVSLHPERPGLRTVDQMLADLRPRLAIPGPRNVRFLRIAGGPPTLKPILVKVRGDSFAAIRAAAADLKGYLATLPAVRDIADDDRAGARQLVLQPDLDAVRRSGLDPLSAGRVARLLVDGEVVTSLQHQGEKVEVRVLAGSDGGGDLDALLRQTLPLADGGTVALGELFAHRTGPAAVNIRHYNFRRAITVEADLDKARLDTAEANRLIRDRWESALKTRHPGIDLDFTGELDDIQESLDAIVALFLFGVGLIYVILGTQFRSYFQPLMILTTVPMAFTGVTLGLLITGNPLSLFTLYGIVALSGIAVNSAIVLISAGNERRRNGMSLLHATLYAARRRVIPILITSLTTVAGLFSLATGLGGKSLLWGPVATAIVWGLVFSTVLTLLVVPLLYRLFMGRAGASTAG
ncbi:MAG TPA: efflux RND transporter permease subunit [Gammaproteobacteria bacterium]